MAAGSARIKTKLSRMSEAGSRGIGKGLLAGLGAGLVAVGLRRQGILGAGLAAAGGAALSTAIRDWLSSRQGARAKAFGKASTVIDRSVSDVFGFCRELANLQSILPRSVMPPGPRIGPTEWQSEVVESRENELLAWRVVCESVEHMGRMEFAPADYGRATSVDFSLWRVPPDAVAQDVQQGVEESLRRLKVVLESRGGAAEFYEAAAAVVATASSMEQASEGWAPESGEPGETRFGYGRGQASSVAGEDVGLAPESGERFMETEEGPIESGAVESDRVIQGSEESFPASDAPSWTPGRA